MFYNRTFVNAGDVDVRLSTNNLNIELLILKKWEKPNTANSNAWFQTISHMTIHLKNPLFFFSYMLKPAERHSDYSRLDILLRLNKQSRVLLEVAPCKMDDTLVRAVPVRPSDECFAVDAASGHVLLEDIISLEGSVEQISVSSSYPSNILLLSPVVQHSTRFIDGRRCSFYARIDSNSFSCITIEGVFELFQGKSIIFTRNLHHYAYQNEIDLNDLDYRNILTTKIKDRYYIFIFSPSPEFEGFSEYRFSVIDETGRELFAQEIACQWLSFDSRYHRQSIDKYSLKFLDHQQVLLLFAVEVDRVCQYSFDYSAFEKRVLLSTFVEDHYLVKTDSSAYKEVGSFTFSSNTTHLLVGVSSRMGLISLYLMRHNPQNSRERIYSSKTYTQTAYGSLYFKEKRLTSFMEESFSVDDDRENQIFNKTDDKLASIESMKIKVLQTSSSSVFSVGYLCFKKRAKGAGLDLELSKKETRIWHPNADPVVKICMVKSYFLVAKNPMDSNKKKSLFVFRTDSRHLLYRIDFPYEQNLMFDCYEHEGKEYFYYYDQKEMTVYNFALAKPRLVWKNLPEGIHQVDVIFKGNLDVTRPTTLTIYLDNSDRSTAAYGLKRLLGFPLQFLKEHTKLVILILICVVLVVLTVFIIFCSKVAKIFRVRVPKTFIQADLKPVTQREILYN